MEAFKVLKCLRARSAYLASSAWAEMAIVGPLGPASVLESAHLAAPWTFFSTYFSWISCISCSVVMGALRFVVDFDMPITRGKVN